MMLAGARGLGMAPAMDRACHADDLLTGLGADEMLLLISLGFATPVDLRPVEFGAAW
jgi:hypothetical protein